MTNNETPANETPANEMFSPVVRELDPVPGGIFSSATCPEIDERRETVFAVDGSAVRELKSGGERDAAARRKERLVAVARTPLPAARLAFTEICREDGYVWDYLLFGALSIADAPKLIGRLLRRNGATARLEADAAKLFAEARALLAPQICDRVSQARQEGYSLAEIQEKQVLPVDFLNRCFEDVLDAAGLRFTATETAFNSPDAELKRRQDEAAAAERALQEKQNRELAMAKAAECREEELETVRRERIIARKEFELKLSELDAKLKEREIELKVKEFKELEKAKLELEKERAETASKNTVEASAAAIDRACERMEALLAALETLGVRKNEVDAAPAPAGGSAPAYSSADVFAGILKKLEGRDALTLRWEAVRETGGCRTRDLLSEAKPGREARGDGVIRIGDRITLRLTSNRPGYLTLFNLGTSGAVSKIFPDRAFGTWNNQIEANHEYTIPGELMPSGNFNDGWWRETGPASSETGLPERILAILTDDPYRLEASSITGEARSVLCRGGFAAVQKELPSLFDLPPDKWSFALVSARVE